MSVMFCFKPYLIVNSIDVVLSAERAELKLPSVSGGAPVAKSGVARSEHGEDLGTWRICHPGFWFKPSICRVNLIGCIHGECGCAACSLFSKDMHLCSRGDCLLDKLW